MDFFDEHRFTPKEADGAKTLISMSIGSANSKKYETGNCYVCQKLIPTKECEICHHKMCNNCSFQCSNCHRTVCTLCHSSNDPNDDPSICYKCLP